MKIYFAWVENKQPLQNIESLKREDLKIFKLTISQKEGEVALARLLVPAGAPVRGSWAVISCEDQNGKVTMLFQGQPLGFPRSFNQDFAEIELSAEPKDAATQLEGVASTLKVAPFYDELFVEPGDDNPVSVLEARPELFCWDRCAGTLGLSNLFEGRRRLDLSEWVLADSLKIGLGDVPFDGIEVEVRAEWLQRAHGEFNLFPKIAGQFSSGQINTLTPNALVRAWPKVGDRLGPEKSRKKSGYQVTRSFLEKINPPRTGALSLYPTLSPEFPLGPDRKPMRLKRSWFKGELWLDWQYRQKRTEVACFTLHHDFQLKGRIRRRHKKLKIQLQNVEGCLPEGSASFFQTSRGKQAIAHGIEMAKAYLAGTARCIEVEFQVPFERALDIGLDDSVVLRGGFIPGGALEGKVMEYRLEVNDQERVVLVRLGVAAGVGQGSVSCRDYQDQQPTQGIINPATLTLETFVKNIQVHGRAEDQIRHLLASFDTEGVSLEGLLGEQTTAVDVELLDLRTQGSLEHRIKLVLEGQWSAPRQVSLGEKL
ncbi:hypothetical protein [Candidatus Finniella inopinata]|uniref:Uncharacterized protein n=1 Tax=Candidatus Finniella inopinata TaxID=1696036 RepID=A0A4Q7DJW4_9PROT|nr:hypothetical protein [Candidatus Finniella inopinata]RZI46569.1 hypothetical protein EQU50_02995 [Candidatus Finniella inopinata]